MRNSLGDLRCACVLWERYIITQDIGKRRIPVLTLERSCAEQHFVNQNAECPPIYCTGMTISLDHFRSDIFFSTYERVGSEICYAEDSLLDLSCFESPISLLEHLLGRIVSRDQSLKALYDPTDAAKCLPMLVLY